MPKRRGLDVAGRGDEVLVDAGAAVGQEPGLRGRGVGERLLGREGLAGDQEQRLVGVDPRQHRGDVVAVDVGDEVKRQAGVGERGQRPHRHLRPEVAAADADVDDVTQSCRRRDIGAGPGRFGELEHRLEHGVHLGRERRLPRRCTQRRVQHGAVLGAVDRGAGEHRIAQRLDSGFARQLGEKVHRRGVDQVLRQVGEHLGRLERQRGDALRIARERLAQVEGAAVRLVVAAERRPGRRAVTAGRRRRGRERRSRRHAGIAWVGPTAARLVGARAGRRSRSCRSCAPLRRRRGHRPSRRARATSPG